MATQRKGSTRERIFQFVNDAISRGEPPTVREVQHALGLSAVETARAHLEKLVAEGRLSKQTGVARGYRLPRNDASPSLLVPLLGHVAAGPLSEAIESPEGFVRVELPSRRLRTAGQRRELFALRVRGESMRDAGILGGDVVIVRRQQDAEDGDIVVALVDGEATVKRLRLRRGRVELLPENPAFAPIALDAKSSLALLGKVIELRRYFESDTGASLP